jgi:hypothetical protein
MKKELILIILMFSIVAVFSTAMADDPVLELGLLKWSDDIEAYTVGEQIPYVSGGDWLYYPGTVSDTNGLVTTVHAKEGSQSVYFDRSDQWNVRLYSLNYKTEGILTFSFMFDDSTDTLHKFVLPIIDRHSDVSIYLRFYNYYGGIYNKPLNPAGAPQKTFVEGFDTNPSCPLTSGVWHDVAIQFDYADTSMGGTGKFDLFFDGEYLGSDVINAPLTDMIHYPAFSGYYGADMYLDDFKYYNTPGEIHPDTGTLIMLFEDDFEEYTLGEQASQPPYLYFDVSPTNGLVTDAQAKSDTQSVLFEYFDQWGFHREHAGTAIGIMRFSFMFKDDLDHRLHVAAFDQYGNIAIYLGFYTDVTGIFDKYGTGGVFAPTSVLTTDVWHDVEIIYDWTERGGVFWMYYDGVLIADNAPLLSQNEGDNKMVKEGFGGFYAVDAYIDDWSAYAIIDPVTITNISCSEQGIVLTLDRPEVTDYKTTIYASDAPSGPWSVAGSLLVVDPDTWTDAGDTSTGRLNPLDPAVTKRFYKAALEPLTMEALPGYYVMSSKYLGTDDIQTSRLGQYTFDMDSETSGTILGKYWEWNENNMNGDVRVSSGHKIGHGDTIPGGNLDWDTDVYTMGDFMAGESAMTTLTGTWSLAGRRIAISWSNGDTENWYMTWEEPGVLYKLELYSASYTDTTFWLSQAAIAGADGTLRDTEAANAGWALGGNTRDFLYARPWGLEMWKNCSGDYIKYNPVPGYFSGIQFMPQRYTSVPWTDNLVMRSAAESPIAPPLIVYGYWADPIPNTGSMSRRILAHVGHDFNDDGRLLPEDDGGHMHVDLQVIDGNGVYRGMVGNEVQENIAGAYWFIDRFYEDEPRFAVFPE